MTIIVQSLAERIRDLQSDELFWSKKYVIENLVSCVFRMIFRGIYPAK